MEHFEIICEKYKTGKKYKCFSCFMLNMGLYARGKIPKVNSTLKLSKKGLYILIQFLKDKKKNLKKDYDSVIYSYFFLKILLDGFEKSVYYHGGINVHALSYVWNGVRNSFLINMNTLWMDVASFLKGFDDDLFQRYISLNK